MSDLNIRNISPDLVAKVKARANMERKTLREAVIYMLEDYASSVEGFGGLNAAHCPVTGPLIKKGRKGDLA